MTAPYVIEARIQRYVDIAAAAGMELELGHASVLCTLQMALPRLTPEDLIRLYGKGE